MNVYSILGLSFWSYLAAGVLAGVIAFLVLMILIKASIRVLPFISSESL